LSSSAKTYSEEERLEKLREVLNGFNPIRTTKKDMRQDWFHGMCLECDFHYPIWFDDTHKDAKCICPLCGAYRSATQSEPNHPDLALWWNCLDGGRAMGKRYREEAIREQRRADKARLSGQPSPVNEEA